MTRDEQSNPPTQLAPGAITHGGAEKTTFAAAPASTAHWLTLSPRDRSR